MDTKSTKRRDNLLYRLRKKGVQCCTRERTIFIPYDQKDPYREVQTKRLNKEFGFQVQLTIV